MDVLNIVLSHLSSSCHASAQAVYVYVQCAVERTTIKRTMQPRSVTISSMAWGEVRRAASLRDGAHPARGETPAEETLNAASASYPQASRRRFRRTCLTKILHAYVPQAPCPVAPVAWRAPTSKRRTLPVEHEQQGTRPFRTTAGHHRSSIQALQNSNQGLSGGNNANDHHSQFHHDAKKP